MSSPNIKKGQKPAQPAAQLKSDKMAQPKKPNMQGNVQKQSLSNLNATQQVSQGSGKQRSAYSLILANKHQTTKNSEKPQGSIQDGLAQANIKSTVAPQLSARKAEDKSSAAKQSKCTAVSTRTSNQTKPIKSPTRETEVKSRRANATISISTRLDVNNTELAKTAQSTKLSRKMAQEDTINTYEIYKNTKPKQQIVASDFGHYKKQSSLSPSCMRKAGEVQSHAIYKAGVELQKNGVSEYLYTAGGNQSSSLQKSEGGMQGSSNNGSVKDNEVQTSQPYSITGKLGHNKQAITKSVGQQHSGDKRTKFGLTEQSSMHSKLIFNDSQQKSQYSQNSNQGSGTNVIDYRGHVSLPIASRMASSDNKQLKYSLRTSGRSSQKSQQSQSSQLSQDFYGTKRLQRQILKRQKAAAANIAEKYRTEHQIQAFTPEDNVKHNDLLEDDSDVGKYDGKVEAMYDNQEDDTEERQDSQDVKSQQSQRPCGSNVGTNTVSSKGCILSDEDNEHGVSGRSPPIKSFLRRGINNKNKKVQAKSTYDDSNQKSVQKKLAKSAQFNSYVRNQPKRNKRNMLSQNLRSTLDMQNTGRKPSLEGQQKENQDILAQSQEIPRKDRKNGQAVQSPNANHGGQTCENQTILSNENVPLMNSARQLDQQQGFRIQKQPQMLLQENGNQQSVPKGKIKNAQGRLSLDINREQREALDVETLSRAGVFSNYNQKVPELDEESPILESISIDLVDSSKNDIDFNMKRLNSPNTQNDKNLLRMDIQSKAAFLKQQQPYDQDKKIRPFQLGQEPADANKEIIMGGRKESKMYSGTQSFQIQKEIVNSENIRKECALQQQARQFPKDQSGTPKGSTRQMIIGHMNESVPKPSQRVHQVMNSQTLDSNRLNKAGASNPQQNIQKIPLSINKRNIGQPPTAMAVGLGRNQPTSKNKQMENKCVPKTQLNLMKHEKDQSSSKKTNIKSTQSNYKVAPSKNSSDYDHKSSAQSLKIPNQAQTIAANSSEGSGAINNENNPKYRLAKSNASLGSQGAGHYSTHQQLIENPSAKNIFTPPPNVLTPPTGGMARISQESIGLAKPIIPIQRDSNLEQRTSFKSLLNADQNGQSSQNNLGVVNGQSNELGPGEGYLPQNQEQMAKLQSQQPFKPPSTEISLLETHYSQMMDSIKCQQLSQKVPARPEEAQDATRIEIPANTDSQNQIISKRTSQRHILKSEYNPQYNPLANRINPLNQQAANISNDKANIDKQISDQNAKNFQNEGPQRMASNRHYPERVEYRGQLKMQGQGGSSTDVYPETVQHPSRNAADQGRSALRQTIQDPINQYIGNQARHDGNRIAEEQKLHNDYENNNKKVQHSFNEDDAQSVQVINVDMEDVELQRTPFADKSFEQNNLSPLFTDQQNEQITLQRNFENYKEAECIPVMKNEAVDGNYSKTTRVPKVNPSDFVPISILGKGSFGEVYLVEKNHTDLYAMKVLSKQKVMGNNYIKYAMTERNVLSYTHHPFIVRLNYAFQTKNKLYLILDYCPGGDLGKYLLRAGPLDESVARLYIAEIVLSIQYLHRREIIFRDLKPDNIVVDAEGHCKLTDFGLSKEGIDDNISASSFCGSLAYLAPEMLSRKGHGKSVDWYLLGVLLYEMLVGKTPYYSTNKEQLLDNIQNSDLYLPRGMSNPAKSLVLQLMERDPCARLGSSHRDAEDIKSHPFFSGLDWGKVLNREYEVPKPDVQKLDAKIDLKKSIFCDLDPSKQLDGSGKARDSSELLNSSAYQASGIVSQSFIKNNVPGWSFIKPLT